MTKFDSADHPSGREGRGLSDLTEAIVTIDGCCFKREVYVKVYKNVELLGRGVAGCTWAENKNFVSVVGAITCMASTIQFN